MLTIIHGDDITNSRKQLQSIVLKAKEKNAEIINLSSKNYNLTDIIQSLESNSLFQSHKLIILEKLLSRTKSNQKKDIVKYLTQQRYHNQNVVIWEPKQITSSQIKKFPQAKISENKIPTVIFKFLDSIIPSNSHQNLQLFKQALENQPTEMIFGMLIKRLRYLTVSKSKNTQLINTFKELRNWQIKRIKTQADNYTYLQLTKLNHQLLDIDYRIKTGQTNLTLQQHLEQILINL